MKVIVKIVFCFVFISFYNNGFSQEINVNIEFENELNNKSNKFKSNPYFLKAQSFFLKKEWDSTLVYSMKQLSLQSKISEINDYCHFFRGFSFYEKKLFNESNKELQKVSEKFLFYNRIKMISGGIALEQSNFLKAISYFQELEQVSNLSYYGIKLSNIKNNLGLCFLHLKDFKKAEYYLLNNIELLEQQKDSLNLIGSYGDVANLYYEQYKDNLAIPYFEKAYHFSKKINNFKLKRITALNMAVVEENRNNFKKSLVYRKEFEQWKDSLNDQNKVWEVAELEKQFAVKQKQKEVNVLEAENKLKIAERNGLLYSSISLLLLLGAGIYFYRQKVKKNKIIEAQKEALDELNATKDKLFSIVSHDLRSSVSALKTSNSKLLENLENKNLVELDALLHQNSAIVNGSYNLLDNLLHWALLQTKQAYFEITSMRLFFIVEQVAFNYNPIMLAKSIHFENKVLKSDVAFSDQESLKIILRNLIDNAIKFTSEKGSIKIYSDNSNELFCNLIIEDNGLGMNESTRLALLSETFLNSKRINESIIGTGLGMQLCKAMIEKNKGKLSIISELGIGTKMIVSLPKTLQNG